MPQASFGERDRRVTAVRRHIDIVHLRDELGCRIGLGLRHHLGKLGIFAPGLEALVPFLLGRIAPNIDERVLGAYAQFGIALLRNPVADIGDPVPRKDRSGVVREPLRERIALSRQRRVDAQLVESRSLPLLSIAPADSGYPEAQSEYCRDFPL